MPLLWDRAYGLGRSIWVYYGRPGYRRAVERFYRELIRPGALCFDIGAHVGNRARAWSRLGATVVAVEPQPDFARLLAWLFRSDRNVTVLPEAIAARPGQVTLLVSPRTPTVTSGSPAFVAAAGRVPGFSWVSWSQELSVPATTLDALIARFGRPDFVKIDVEGMEAEVLTGLTEPLAALSFEFVPAHREAALASLDRLAALGRYRFNVALGETMAFALPSWVDDAALRAWLAGRPAEGDSGDIYARLEG